MSASSALEPFNAFSLKPSPTKPLHKQTHLLVSIPNGRHSVVHFPCPRKTGWTASAVSHSRRHNAVCLLIDSQRKVGDGQRQSDTAKQSVLTMYQWRLYWYASALNFCLSYKSHLRAMSVYVAQWKCFQFLPLIENMQKVVVFDDN